MNKGSENPYIKFYGQHDVSPVRQDISNIRQHYERREKLYRFLGLPPIIFQGKRVMEVGPGGGYNSLYFLEMGATLDLVEPNKKGREEIAQLFEKYNVSPYKWRVFDCTIEELEINDKYDIVIAEGFISGILNKSSVVNKLKKIVKDGGVVVVTCADEISLFFEYVKRSIARKLIEGIDDFGKKVEILSKAFLAHLESLKYASRPIEDWVIDSLLNPAICYGSFSIGECITAFEDDFYFLGSSPNMFTDYTWYKDTSINSMSLILEQFENKRHLLLITGLEDGTRNKKNNIELLESARKFREIIFSLEEFGYGDDNGKLAIDLLKHIYLITADIHIRISEAISEAINLLEDKQLNWEKVSTSSKLAHAFGRGQQYVSLIKKNQY